MDLFKLVGTIAVETREVDDALSETKNKAKNVSDGFDEADGAARNLSKGGFTVLKSAAGNLVAEGFSRLISAVGEFVSSGVDFQKQIEQYETSFAVMTGSEEKAIEVTERLQKIGAETPFELTNLADTTQLLMNYGFTADDAIDKMMMLGDISQGSSDKMNRIATAYGQMSSAGKVSLEDIKQMIEAGFNPLQEISQTTGESMASLYDRISKGKISVDEITASMKRSTAEGGKYFGSMDAQSQTLDGRLSTLKDTAMGTFGEMFGGLLQKAADEWIPAVTEKLEKFSEKIPAIQEKIEKLKEKFGEAKEFAVSTFEPLISVLVRVKESLQPVIDKVNEYFTSGQAATDGTTLLQGAITILAVVLQSIATIFLYVVETINFVSNGLKGLHEDCVEFVTSIPERFEEFKERIETTIMTLVSKALALWESMKSGFAEKVENIKSNVQEKFQNIKDTIEEKITGAKTKVTEVFGSIKNEIQSKIEDARDKVGEAIEKMKSFFNFEWKLPKIKLPHFKKTGEDSLGLPQISVEWYKKGAVLNQPTVFGMNPATGSAMVGGEAGAEAVAPIDVLQGYVAEAVASQNAGLITVLERILDAILAMDENMGGNLREALDGTAFKINNREFGRLVRTVV